MSRTRISRDISLSFALLFWCAIGCMGCLTALTLTTLRTTLNGQKTHSQGFVPAKRLTAGFERELLNARIFFIYFVTIQKPGSLESGWKRYHNAETRIQDLSTLVDSRPDLHMLRAPLDKLKADVASYGESLSATLNMVQGGELKGPHYDAQVKEWAARGAVMVTDAGALEVLCFNASEADTNSLGDILRRGQTNILLVFAAGTLFCLLCAIALAWRIHRLLRKEVERPATMKTGKILELTRHTA